MKQIMNPLLRKEPGWKVSSIPSNSYIVQVSKLYKQGQSLAQGGVFKSPGADKAVKLFNEAMNIIRGISVPFPESVEWKLKLLEALAKVHGDMGFYLDAAKSLEEACRVAKNFEMKFNTKYPKIPQYCTGASQYYIKKGEYSGASIMLQICGRYLYDVKKDTETSIARFDQACKILETHKQGRFDFCFDQAVEYTLRAKKYTKAIELLEREIAMYELDPNKALGPIWGRVTGIVLIYYAKGQLDAAEIRYDQAYEKYCKSSLDWTEQRTLCQQFLDVFGKRDRDGLDKIKKSGDLKTLLPKSLAAFAGRSTIV